MNEEKGQFCAYLSNLHSSFEDCETFVATKMKRNSVKEGVEIKKYYYVFMLHCLRFDKSLKKILNVMLARISQLQEAYLRSSLGSNETRKIKPWLSTGILYWIRATFCVDLTLRIKVVHSFIFHITQYEHVM